MFVPLQDKILFIIQPILFLENVMVRNNVIIILLHAIAIFKLLILSLTLSLQ